MENEYNTNMNIPSLNDMAELDRELYGTAMYDVTNGRLLFASSQESFQELNRQIFERFNYYKMLIRTNECSLSFLQYAVFRKYSALTDAEFVTKYGEYSETKNKAYMANPEDLGLEKIMSYVVNNPTYKKMLLDPLSESEAKKLRKKTPKKSEPPKDEPQEL